VGTDLGFGLMGERAKVERCSTINKAFKHGLIYVRVSDLKQVDGGSLDVQTNACQEYARKNNINVLKVFTEKGESAKFADRTKLLELIDYCRRERNKLDLLIVWKLDRFSRIVADHFSIKATLLKYGVRVVSVTEPINNDAQGNLMETMLAGFAQFDNDVRTMRTIEGMKQKLREGIWPWRPPLGYKVQTKPGEKKKKT